MRNRIPSLAAAAALLAATAAVAMPPQPSPDIHFIGPRGNIQRGVRCATPTPSRAEVQAVERQLAGMRSLYGAARPGRRPPDPGRLARHPRRRRRQRARGDARRADRSAQRRAPEQRLPVRHVPGQPRRRPALVQQLLRAGHSYEARSRRGSCEQPQHLHLPAQGRHPGLRLSALVLRRDGRAARRGRPPLLAPWRQRRALQRGRHRHPRGRSLPGSASTPSRTAAATRATRWPTPRSRPARPSAAPPAATPARRPGSTRSRTSWTTPTTPACSSSAPGRTRGCDDIVAAYKPGLLN